jgi:hypothetical protein
LGILLVLITTLPAQAGTGMPEIGWTQMGPYRARLMNDSATIRTGANTLTVHVPDLPVGEGVTLQLHGPRGEVIDVPLYRLRLLGDAGERHAVAPASSIIPASGSTGTMSAGHGHAPTAEAATRVEDHAGHRDPGKAPAGAQPPDHSGHGQPAPGSGVARESAAHADATGATADADDHSAGAPGGHGTDAHGPDIVTGFAARGTARVPATGAWRAVLTAGDGHGPPMTGELALAVTSDGPSLLYLGFLGVLSGGSVLYGWVHRRRGQSRD